MSFPTVRVSFWGAAGVVTGSKTLIDSGDRSILVDCGIFQGKKENRLKNWADAPFAIEKLSAVVLTHAHIDHSGYLPVIVRNGFSGPIFCTPATQQLLHLLLFDAANLQEEEARFVNKHKVSKHKPAKPLFDRKDVEKTLKQIRTIERGKVNQILPGVEVRAKCAGHILGSTALHISLSNKTITFSGDIGRYDMPILPDPQGIDLGDLLVCESTYGNRDHSESNVYEQLEKAVKSAVERKGPLLIPAFSVGRSQAVLYYLAELEREGRIPVLPTIVDSPMAINATEIYREFRHDYDDEAKELLEDGEKPLATQMTAFCKRRSDSKRLNTLSGARIILSASGMLNGGRILHHLKHQLPKEETTLLFVGYQAEGTRGHIIQSGAPSVKIFGEYVPVRAHVESVSGLSAHGDRNELLKWLKSSSGSPSIVRVNHGEKEPAAAFSSLLEKEFSWRAEPARYGEKLEL